MQLIYYPDLPDFTQFGIQIPVLDTRATKTLEKLRSHPKLGPLVENILETRELEEVGRSDLARLHSPEYVEGLYSDRLEELLLKAYELIDENGDYHRYAPDQARRPLTDIFQVQMRRVAGSLQCMRSSLKEGFCFFFGGGFHHAHSDFGHGFCPVNDIVTGIRRLQSEGLIKSAWVIDGDAHKGDGTAALTKDDPTISTLSIHMADGWPLDLPRTFPDGSPHPSFTPSTVDIPIHEGDEAEYINKLQSGLEELRSAAPDPDLAVVVFGADPYEKDGLESAAKLRLSLEQLRQRDELIYNTLKELKIPAAYLMAGGYGPHVWEVYYQFLEGLLNKEGKLSHDA